MLSKVVVAFTADRLVEYMNTYIAEGWKPLGGVAVGLGPCYILAMTKDEEH